jgi:hypothetical protein
MEQNSPVTRKSRRNQRNGSKSRFWELKSSLNPIREYNLSFILACTTSSIISIAVIVQNIYYGIIFALIVANIVTFWHLKKQIAKSKPAPRRFHKKRVYNEEETNNARYEIICQDAVKWLNNQTELEGFVVTSLPDYTEMPHFTIDEWKQWFQDTVTLILDKLPEGASCIFYQTDVKIMIREREGTEDKKRVVCEEYIDKSHLCMLGAAKSKNVKMLWHKLFLMTYVGVVKFARPNFSHMLCFGKNTNDKLERFPLPDVLDRGDMIYPKATGINACMLAMTYCKNAGAKTIIDPFCGKGSILLAANYMGMDAIGIDIGTTRCREAKKMREKHMQQFVDVVQTKSFFA